MRTFDMDMKVKEIDNWLQTQLQLPQCIDKNLIKRFIYSMHGDLQRTKRMIDAHYRLRAKYHRIFMQRDPQDDISQKVLSAIDFIELPGKTQDNCKVLLYRFNNSRAAKFSFIEAIKVYFMMTDCQYATSFDEDIQGEIILIDMMGFNLQHLARIQLATLNIFLKFLHEAHPMRLKAIHFLNCPSYMEKFLKFSTKTQYFNKMNFHLLNKENCDKSLPTDLLPQEYGGQAGELANLRQYWLCQLYEKRYTNRSSRSFKSLTQSRRRCHMVSTLHLLVKATIIIMFADKFEFSVLQKHQAIIFVLVIDSQCELIEKKYLLDDTIW